jgi:hypothetical protein
MTVVKVVDGIALAADSAFTFYGTGYNVGHVYNGVEKLFHMHDELPICAMVYGMYTFGAESAQLLLRQMRKRFTDGDWALERDSYKIEDVVSKIKDEFHQKASRAWTVRPPYPLGIVVAGYSAGSQSPEVWEATVRGSEPSELALSLGPNETGMRAYAQNRVVHRLVHGWDFKFGIALLRLVPVELREDLKNIMRDQRVDPENPFMPLPDAVALAKYLVDTTVSFSSFTSAIPTVGGPVDVASVSLHDGFRWVARKGYTLP